MKSKHGSKGLKSPETQKSSLAVSVQKWWEETKSRFVLNNPKSVFQFKTGECLPYKMKKQFCIYIPIFFPPTAIIKSTTAQFRGNLEYLSTINTCVGFNSWWCKVCLWKLVHRVSTPCLMPLNHPLPKPAFPSTSQIHLPHL